MASTKSSTNQTSTNSTSGKSPDEGKKGKTPAKPISLYPMSEEEALKRLLRVPPPGKDGKEEVGTKS